jgi:GTP-binding protein YchF
MSLSVGIVGLPNVGKSTLFNALLKKQQAHVASFPFTTIEPNVGIVPVPDPRIEKLAQVVKESKEMKEAPPIVPATVKFVDIAGLVAGAHKGEGLGNQFLAHIREATVICHVLRFFEDPNISKEGTNPDSDLETVETELKLADLATLEKQEEPKGSVDKDERTRWEVVKKFRQALESGTPARGVDLDEEEQKVSQTLSLLTAKPILVVLNIAEEDLRRAGDIEKEYAQKLGLKQNQVVAISAKLENELAQLPEEEQERYLAEYAIKNPSLERLIKKAYATLDLISFLTTTGGKEVRAWTLPRGKNALKAAGTIHTDFEKNFIKADVIPWEEFVSAGGWESAREKGKVRTEGKNYIVQDGDVIEFKTGT